MTTWEHRKQLGGGHHTIRTGEIGGVKYRATRYDDGLPGGIETFPQVKDEHLEVAKRIFGDVEFVTDPTEEFPVHISEYTQTIANLGITLEDVERDEEDYAA